MAAIFDGRYQWDGTKRGEREPIAWSGGAYEVKIFQCGSPAGKVEHLKTHVCVYAPTGEGQSISANPEKFAKQICKDFSLDFERVLWVEDLLVEEDRYEVVMFSRSSRVGNTIFYIAEKRKATMYETRQIEQEFAEQ